MPQSYSSSNYTFYRNSGVGGRGDGQRGSRWAREQATAEPISLETDGERGSQDAGSRARTQWRSNSPDRERLNMRLNAIVRHKVDMTIETEQILAEINEMQKDSATGLSRREGSKGTTCGSREDNNERKRGKRRSSQNESLDFMLENLPSEWALSTGGSQGSNKEVAELWEQYVPRESIQQEHYRPRERTLSSRGGSLAGSKERLSSKEMMSSRQGSKESKRSSRATSKERKGSKTSHSEERRGSKGSKGSPSGSRNSSKEDTSDTEKPMSPEEEGMVAYLRSPDFMWEHYLQHFDLYQLEYLSDEFEGRSNHSEEHDRRNSRISVESAIEIGLQGIMKEYHCRHPQLSTEKLDEVLQEVGGGSSPESFLFEQMLLFLKIYETRMLEECERGGFLEERIMDFEDAFASRCKGEVASKGALSKQDIFEVLEIMGRDLSDVETQQQLVELIKEVDLDCSSDIDFREFLLLMRKLECRDAIVQRRRDHHLISQSGFSDAEIDCFQHVFDQYADADDVDDDDPGLGQKALRKLLDNLEPNMEDEPRRQLAETIYEILCSGEQVEVNDACSFSQFVTLLGKLVDVNFVRIHERLEKLIKDHVRGEDDAAGMDEKDEPLSPLSVHWKPPSHSDDIAILSSPGRLQNVVEPKQRISCWRRMIWAKKRLAAKFHAPPTRQTFPEIAERNKRPSLIPQ